MEITREQYERIKPYLPVQRGHVEINNDIMINAILYIVENGCKWRAVPKWFGKWNSVYQRCRRWNQKGVLKRLFEGLQKEQILSVRIEILALDSTSLKVHPDAHGALKKKGNRPLAKAEEAGIPNFMWYPQMTKP
jgi:transposase